MTYKRDGLVYSSYQEYQMICKIDKEIKRKKKGNQHANRSNELVRQSNSN